jgi:hypothetical protein
MILPIVIECDRLRRELAMLKEMMPKVREEKVTAQYSTVQHSTASLGSPLSY